MKKLIIIFLAILTLTSANIQNISAVSDSEFEEKESYYTDKCYAVDEIAEADQEVCAAFASWMTSKSSDLADKKAEIDSEISKVGANIQAQVDQIQGYQTEVDTLNSEISALNTKIDALETKIEAKALEIAETEDKITVLKAKVEARMVASQPTMKLNVMVDFLMGAKSFTDFIRRANGITAITDYDEEIRGELKDLIDQLEIDKQVIEADKLEVEVDKSDLTSKANDIIALKYKAEELKKAYMSQEEELMAQGNQVAGDIEKFKAMAAELQQKLSTIVSSSGFIRPINGGRISAGTWHYPASFGGGLHLGVDYASSKGTTIMAIGNGVVVSSSDGCGDGYLGNTCGGQNGGLSLGGNQFFMVVSVNGKTYGVRGFHLLNGTVVSTGTVVQQGDKIGEIGTSGNSTGPHLHIEVMYLGTMSVSDYISTWNGSLSFGTSYGSSALNYMCENGASAPCRIRPETLFE